MKKLIQITTALIVSTAFLTSCSTVFMANPGIDPIVFSKPAYNDSVSASSFVGGKFNRSEYLNQYEKLADNYFGQVYIFQTITNKYYNTSYGAFGYLGKVGMEEVENNFETNYSSYFGGGVSADMQFTIPVRNLIIQPVGIKGSLIYEDGQYYKYRAAEWNGINSSPDKFMFNLSQTAGIDYCFRKSSIGLDISAGYSFMIPHMFMDMTYSVILNYSTPKFMIYLQKSATLLMSNDDLVVGFNYRL